MEIEKDKNYIDAQGKIWQVQFNEVAQELMLWNEESGWGNWDDGRNLQEMK